LSYFSNGSPRGALRVGASPCPETLISVASERRQTNKPAVKTVEDLIEWAG